MTTSAPPAWAYSRNLPVADTSRAPNDSPDPTYQDCWPSKRYPSDGPDDHMMRDETTKVSPDVINAVQSHADGVQSGRETPTNLPVGAPNEHPAWVCRDCGQDQPNECATWHIGTCGICGREMEVTEPRDFGNNGNNPVITGNNSLPDIHSDGEEGHKRENEPPIVKVESCSECGAVTDTDSIFQEQAIFPPVESSGDVKVESCSEYGQMREEALDAQTDDFSIPFPVQSWIFEALIETEVDLLHEIIDDHHDEIVELARKRHREGYKAYGSAAYAWGSAERFRNVLEELADAVAYLTTGAVK